MSVWALLSWATKASTVVMEVRETVDVSLDTAEVLTAVRNWWSSQDDAKGGCMYLKIRAMLPDREVQGRLPRGSHGGGCWSQPVSRFQVNITLSSQCSCCWENVDYGYRNGHFTGRMKLCGLKWVECDCGTPPGAWSEITRKPVLLWGEAGYSPVQRGQNKPTSKGLSPGCRMHV